MYLVSCIFVFFHIVIYKPKNGFSYKFDPKYLQNLLSYKTIKTIITSNFKTNYKINLLYWKIKIYNMINRLLIHRC